MRHEYDFAEGVARKIKEEGDERIKNVDEETEIDLLKKLSKVPEGPTKDFLCAVFEVVAGKCPSDCVEKHDMEVDVSNGGS